jgi:hypothetical protein
MRKGVPNIARNIKVESLKHYGTVSLIMDKIDIDSVIIIGGGALKLDHILTHLTPHLKIVVIDKVVTESRDDEIVFIDDFFTQDTYDQAMALLAGMNAQKTMLLCLDVLMFPDSADTTALITEIANVRHPFCAMNVVVNHTQMNRFDAANLIYRSDQHIVPPTINLPQFNESYINTLNNNNESNFDPETAMMRIPATNPRFASLKYTTSRYDPITPVNYDDIITILGDATILSISAGFEGLMTAISAGEHPITNVLHAGTTSQMFPLIFFGYE